MAQSILLLPGVPLLLCLVAGALSASLSREAYTEAIPSRDFTRQNMSSSVRDIFAAAQTGFETRSKRSGCGCTTTSGAYGGTQGTGFVDVLRHPCESQITDIWVRHGTVVDALQLRYKLLTGELKTTPLHGGNGGGLTHIKVPHGGRVTGITGGIGALPNYGQLVSQLRILVLDAKGQLLIYGPFGTDLYSFPGSFAVYGNIKSIVGYYGLYLNALGMYYEPWGTCGGPCGTPGQ